MTKEVNHDRIFDEVKKLNQPHQLTVADESGKTAEVLVLPDGLKAHSIKGYIDEYRIAPERRKGTAKVTSLESFINHVTRFKDDDSAIFADNKQESPSLLAVLDYHRKTAEGAPRFGDHRTFYPFPLSKEWQAWMKQNGQPMAQADFAAFLEDRIGDVLAPLDGDENGDEKLQQLSQLLGGNFAGPAKLMEISRGLSVNESARVKNATNISSGESQIVYETEHHDATGAPLKVPNMFLIGIPVFEMGTPYRIAVRLRYRLRSGTIAWFYELYRSEHVFDDAFDEACKEAGEKTGLPVFMGKPE